MGEKICSVFMRRKKKIINKRMIKYHGDKHLLFVKKETVSVLSKEIATP